MRIAQVMLGKGFGGAERSFVDITRALCRRGHQVLAVCEHRGEALRQIEQVEGVLCVSVHVRGSWDLFARRAIKSYLADYRVDIVQMHLARAAAIAGPPAKALGLPSLSKTHNYVSLKYYRAIDHLVATTAKQQAYLIAQGASAARVSRIPNFSAIQPAATSSNASAEGRIRIAAVGRLVHKKGFDLLFEAIARVRQRGLDVSLALAGTGPEQDALERLRAKLNLSEHVEFLGWQDSVAQCLADADLFVLPSRDEPFGIVCLEAMALNVPIIATTTDGPLEFLDVQTATLVAPEDVLALADAISLFATERTIARSRAVCARERFEHCFSETVVVEQYLELYERLIGAASVGH